MNLYEDTLNQLCSMKSSCTGLCHGHALAAGQTMFPIAMVQLIFLASLQAVGPMQNSLENNDVNFGYEA